jgi:hypothetical protein
MSLRRNSVPIGKLRPQSIQSVAVACVCAATAFSGCVETPWAPRTRDGGEWRDIAQHRKPDGVVCPGIILKVGPRVELPCARGAEILKAESVRIGGRYCGRVTYVLGTGSLARTETLCAGDVSPSGAFSLPR